MTERECRLCGKSISLESSSYDDCHCQSPVITEPVHPNDCDHPPGSFLFSVNTLLRRGETQWYDVYLYEDSREGQSVCLRYGPGSEYLSPGKLERVIANGLDGAYPYNVVWREMRRTGILSWNPKEAGDD